MRSFQKERYIEKNRNVCPEEGEIYNGVNKNNMDVFSGPDTWDEMAECPDWKRVVCGGA